MATLACSTILTARPLLYFFEVNSPSSRRYEASAAARSSPYSSTWARKNRYSKSQYSPRSAAQVVFREQPAKGGEVIRRGQRGQKRRPLVFGDEAEVVDSPHLALERARPPPFRPRFLAGPHGGTAGKEGNPKAAAYSASKAGVIALTKSLGKELAGFDIAVNCITPAAAQDGPILDADARRQHIEYMLLEDPAQPLPAGSMKWRRWWRGWCRPRTRSRRERCST